MSIEVGILIGLVSVIIAVGSFFIARLKDAEERGALKQRVLTLEDRQDRTDKKLDEIMTMLGDIKQSITRLFAERKVEKECSGGA